MQILRARGLIAAKGSIPMMAALVIAHALVACGGARPIQDGDAVAADEEGGGRRARRAPRAGERSDEEPEEDAEAPAEDDEEPIAEGEVDFPLGERVTIPGTGVSLEPPRGTERSASGSTLVHPRRRLQIVIAAAEGDLSVHQQFRSGLRASAEELESEEIQVNGVPATLVIDRMEQGQTQLERVWIVARQGTRSVAVMGLYAANRSEQMRAYLRTSVLTTQIDAAVAIDPEAALGYRIDPGTGLQLVRAASTNVTYSTDGQPPPGVGQPMMLLMPLPIDVPATERTELCPQILGQLVQLSGGPDLQQGTIEGGELTGCDRSVTTTEDPRLATYTALVFRGDAAFMILGSTEASGGTRWLPRFRAAARTLAPVTR